MVKQIPSKEIVRQTVRYRELIDKHGPDLRKLVPGFDKLPMKMQGDAAMRKNLQEYFPDDELYTDEGILGMILGLATEDYHRVGKDSSGRRKSLGQAKKLAPAGYKRGGRVKMKHGGKACRGRKANYKA